MKTRGKAIGLLFFIALFCFSITAQAAAIKLRIKVPNANVRAEPGAAARIIFQAPQGTILESENRQGEWYRVAIPGPVGGVTKYGFIHQSTVDVIEESKEVPKQEKTDARKEEGKKVEEKQKVEEKKEVEVSEEVGWIIKKGKAKAPSKTEANKEIPSNESLQNRKSQPIGMGLKIGTNFTNLSMDVEDEVQSIMGFCVGGSVTLGLNEFLELEPEILFATKRSRQFTDYYGSSYSNEIEWRSTVIEVPVLIRASIPLGDVFRPFIFAGPYSSIRIGGKKIVTTKYKGKSLSEEEEGADLKLFDFGYAFGAGCGFQIGGGSRLSLQIRFTNGLANIFDSKNSPITWIQSIKTRNLSLILGFSI